MIFILNISVLFFFPAALGLELRSLLSFRSVVQVESFKELVLAGHLPPQDQIKVPLPSVLLQQQGPDSLSPELSL